MFDVVIPYHGRYDWLSVCLTALARFSSNPLHVILVDNASPKDEEAAHLRGTEVAGGKFGTLGLTLTEINPRMTISTIRLGENKSFSHSVNAGVAHGTSKYVCVLNSDVVVTPGWDAVLLTHLADETVGLVGPRTNYASGVQGTADRLPAPFLIFFCVAFRRATWDAVGPLDAETFCDWSGGEDLDYSWRVKEHGLSLVVADLFVHHGGSQTYRGTEVHPETQQAMHDRANLRLEKKWGPGSFAQRTATDRQKKVGIGLIMADRRLDYEYFRSMIDLLQRCGSERRTPFYWCEVSRTSPGVARNMVAKWAVEHAAHLDYLLFVDDDMRFPPEFLSRLIGHDVDVVAGLAYKRKPPFGTVAYSWRNEGEGYAAFEGIEHQGLMKVDAVGFGGALMKVDVLRRMQKPYFDFNAKFGEDLGFCKKAQDEARAEIYVDTDLIMGHVGDPAVIDEAYVRAYRLGQQRKAEGQASLEQLVPA
jgi:GT2 family glycosyltransferase